MNRYHESRSCVAVADWMMTGVLHPVAPPSVRVVFGRNTRDDASGVAAYPIAVVGLITLTTLASIAPGAVMVSEYSPSARQAEFTTPLQNGWSVSPLE